MNPTIPIETTPEELYTLIGERELVIFKLNRKISELFTQIDEMANEITKLRKENGKLEQSPNNVAV